MGRVGSMLQRQLFLDGKHVQSQENISELLLWLDNSLALLKYGGVKKNINFTKVASQCQSVPHF